MIGENIKIARKMCGYTQQQIADLLGIDRSTYAYYETGKTQLQIDHLAVLAGSFGVSCEELLHKHPDQLFDSGAQKSEKKYPGMAMLSREEQNLLLKIRKYDLLANVEAFVETMEDEIHNGEKG